MFMKEESKKSFFFLWFITTGAIEFHFYIKLAKNLICIYICGGRNAIIWRLAVTEKYDRSLWLEYQSIRVFAINQSSIKKITYSRLTNTTTLLFIFKFLMKQNESWTNNIGIRMYIIRVMKLIYLLINLPYLSSTDKSNLCSSCKLDQCKILWRFIHVVLFLACVETIAIEISVIKKWSSPTTADWSNLQKS